MSLDEPHGGLRERERLQGSFGSRVVDLLTDWDANVIEATEEFRERLACLGCERDGRTEFASVASRGAGAAPVSLR